MDVMMSVVFFNAVLSVVMPERQLLSARWRRDNQLNNTQHNDIQHYDTQHNGLVCDS